MNCFNHPQEDSTAVCIDCGKGLCNACAAKYEIAICSDCNKKRNEVDKNAAIKRLKPTFILLGLGLIYGIYLSIRNLVLTGNISALGFILAGVFLGWLISGIFWGWSVVKNWFPPKSYILTGKNAWSNAFFIKYFLPIFKLLFKILLAYLIGFVAMPVGLVKTIIDLKKAKDINDIENANKTDNTNNNEE